MRGRLGIGTEWILDDGNQWHMAILAVVPAEIAYLEREDSVGASRRPQCADGDFLKYDGCRDVVGANLSHLESPANSLRRRSPPPFVTDDCASRCS
jgi:hypothetical protein